MLFQEIDRSLLKELGPQGQGAPEQIEELLNLVHCFYIFGHV